MICDFVPIPGDGPLGGGTAIVCSRGPRKRCRCGKVATLACDWKVATKKSGTCDAPTCSTCTTSPAPDKDLCRDHAVAYKAWRSARQPDPA